MAKITIEYDDGMTCTYEGRVTMTTNSPEYVDTRSLSDPMPRATGGGQVHVQMEYFRSKTKANG